MSIDTQKASTLTVIVSYTHFSCQFSWGDVWLAADLSRWRLYLTYSLVLHTWMESGVLVLLLSFCLFVISSLSPLSSLIHSHRKNNTEHMQQTCGSRVPLLLTLILPRHFPVVVSLAPPKPVIPTVWLPSPVQIHSSAHDPSSNTTSFFQVSSLRIH